MHKLHPVEDAKVLMNEAKDWSVWYWLFQKKKVRTAADLAWEALDEAEAKIKDSWSDDLKKAWCEQEARWAPEVKGPGKRRIDRARQEAAGIDPSIKATAERLKKLDEDAYKLRMTAEETFAEAERSLSSSLAREGSRQAIEAWEVRESVLRRFEAAARKRAADLAQSG